MQADDLHGHQGTSALLGWLGSRLSTSPQPISSSHAELLMPRSCLSDVSTPRVILSFPQGSVVKISLANFPGYFQ